MSSHPIPSPSSVATTDSTAERRRAARRRAAGAALVAGAAAVAAAAIVHPHGGGEGAAGLALEMASDPGAWTLWSLLIMAAALLQLPAVLAWRSLVVTGRGSVLVGIGSLMTAMSLVALFAFGQSHGQAATLVGSPPISPEVLAAIERTDSAPTLAITVILALFGYHAGWPVLFAGLARAGVLPVPLAIVGAAAAVASFLASPLGGIAEPAAFIVLAAALAGAGLRLVYPSAGGRK